MRLFDEMRESLIIKNSARFSSRKVRKRGSLLLLGGSSCRVRTRPRRTQAHTHTLLKYVFAGCVCPENIYIYMGRILIWIAPRRPEANSGRERTNG